MSDYLSRSEIDKQLLDALSDSEDCDTISNKSIESVVSEIDDFVCNLEEIDNDDGFIGVDDLFASDSETIVSEEQPVVGIEHQVRYTAKSGNESRNYLAHKPRPTRRTIANIVREQPGLKSTGRVNTIDESFYKVFPEEAVRLIVTHSNEEALLRNKEPTNETEILAFIGILILQGANNDSKLDYHDLWSNEFGRASYIAGMSRNRYRDLLSIIRFDDKQTRQNRRVHDKLAPIRELFEIINNGLCLHFTPSVNVVIDEMLSLFRGRCPFKVFIKEKPGKYGILIRLLADCYQRMVLNMEVYAGKRQDVPTGTIPIVKRLIAPISNTGRNVTTDRYYTSVPLAEELYEEHGLTLVGTMQSNRKFIPKEMKEVTNRPLYSSFFAFTDASTKRPPVTLQSYIAREKPKRNLIFLSTQHTDDNVSTEGKMKSDINLFYNSTKGGVDSIDQMARKYSTKRSTRRWPLSLFYTLIDIACINAYSLYIQNYQDWNKAKTNRRRIYLQELGLQLIKPYVANRSKNLIGLQKPVVMAMESILGCKLTLPTPAKQPRMSGKGRCYMCCAAASSKREMINKLSKTTILCCTCEKYVCGRHSEKTNICYKCKTEAELSE